MPADRDDCVGKCRVDGAVEQGSLVDDQRFSDDPSLYATVLEEFDPFRRAELTLYGAENGDGSGHYIRADVAIFPDGQSVVRNHDASFDPPLDD